MRFILYHKLIYITLMAGNLACLLILGQEDFLRIPKIGIPITLVFLTLHIHNFIRIKSKNIAYKFLLFEEFLTMGRMVMPLLILTIYFGWFFLLIVSPVSCTLWLPLSKPILLFPGWTIWTILLYFLFLIGVLMFIESAYLRKLRLLKNSQFVGER